MSIPDSFRLIKRRRCILQNKPIYNGLDINNCHHTHSSRIVLWGNLIVYFFYLKRILACMVTSLLQRYKQYHLSECNVVKKHTSSELWYRIPVKLSVKKYHGDAITTLGCQTSKTSPAKFVRFVLTWFIGIHRILIR